MKACPSQDPASEPARTLQNVHHSCAVNAHANSDREITTRTHTQGPLYTKTNLDRLDTESFIISMHTQTHHCAQTHLRRLDVTMPNPFLSVNTNSNSQTFRHISRWTGCSNPNNCCNSRNDSCESLNDRLDREMASFTQSVTPAYTVGV